ncbi:MFS transporter, partial [Streptomyces sp. NPDC056437]|uniref:MFS transporter n=1 Tax=Streptomyces sp. NPDC056437 TaxID=3345816 RepID=UPI0036C8D8D5
VFLINLPVMAVLVVVGIKLLPESRNPDPGPWDLISVALSLIGIVAVVYAVKEATVHGLRPDTCGAAVIGIAALVWFVRRQLTLPSPLLDVRLFHHKGFSGAVLADLLTILGLSGLVFFLSQFLQLVQGRSPLEAGLIELPAAIGAVGAGLLAGYAARRASVRSAVSAGLAAVGLALAACTLLTADTSALMLGVALFVGGLGAGLAFTVTADVILSTVPKEQAGAASAVSETAYELGAALGIALLGTVVTGVYRDFTVPQGVPAGAAEAARDSLGGAVEVAEGLPSHQGEALLASVQNAFTEGFHVAGAVGSAVLFATALAAWFLLRGQRLESGIEH